MAKKLTPQQAEDVRDQLGLDDNPVEQEFRTAAPRAATPTGAQIAASAQPTEPSHSLWDEAKAAFRVDNTATRMLSKEAEEYPIDLNYDGGQFVKDNMERIEALKGADMEELSQDLGSAYSALHAESRLRQMERDWKDEQMLLEGGASALGLRIGAALLDPVDMALALSTGGIAGGLVKAGKTGKMITSALSAGVAAGGTEAMLSSDNVMRDEFDVGMAALAGVSLGGLVGRLTAKEDKALKGALEDLANDNVDGAARHLGIPDDSAGAARRKLESVKDNDPLIKNTDEVLDEMEAPEFRFKFLNKLMGNLQGSLFYQNSSTVRKVASTMFEGGFLKDKNKARKLTAEGRANQLQDVFERGVYGETLSDFKGWAKRLNKGSARRIFTTSVGEEFYSQVGKAMRGITDGIEPEALAAAGKIRKHMDNVYELARRAGVKGFEKGQLEDYFPRMINRAKFQEARVKYKDDVLEEFFFDAIIKDDIGDKLARKIARGYVRIMREKTAGIENDLLHGIRMDDVDRLRDIFKDWPEVEDLIAEIETMKAKENAQRGGVSFGKRRIQFNENHSDLMKDGSTLRFTDLYENDARMVLSRYGRAMHGHIAMAETLGVKSRADFEELTKRMASEVELEGGNAAKVEQAFRDGYDLMLGQPIERWNPSGDAAQMSRTLSAWNYATRGGQFGVNALAEAGNIIGQAGWRAFTRVFPDTLAVMKRAADGELEHPVARFAELTFAPGVQTLTKPAVRNLDELNESFGGSSVLQRFAAKLDPYMKSAGRFTSMASGLAPITDATQRLSAVAYIDKLARFAKRAPGKKQVERLRAAGLDADMEQRIYAMFREAGVYRKGRLVDIDIDKWTDSEALDAFSQSASREVRNAIQMADISTSTILLNHPAGRLIFQFMRFPMDAVNKQLLRGIHHADGETAMAWSASFGIGALAYMGQTSIEFANDPEERAKRLDPKNIARVAYMRTGFSSMTPGVIDTGLHVLGIDPQFSLGRSSGLSTVIPIGGNPSMTFGKNLWTAGTAIPRSLLNDDIQYSQADARATAQLFPGYKLLGMHNAVHGFEQLFPESRKQE